MKLELHLNENLNELRA